MKASDPEKSLDCEKCKAENVPTPTLFFNGLKKRLCPTCRVGYHEYLHNKRRTDLGVKESDDAN